ncbi:hypothetical protein [Cellulosimicrobium cellulans]|uniref:hypothetical protein n=1 Tax=Cellulosimicrobium cellulans TaxID=1710 RepID=UPI0020971B0A|nr:hypothetical protein [Cellulosimicrobium cellulans]MCO7273342.1 hypothetical protein [Cellulosimicrobium cellulans]
MSRKVPVSLMVLGILLGVVSLVIGYTVSVISDNPLAEDGVPRSQVTLLLGCAVTTMAIGGAVAVLGFTGFFAKPALHPTSHANA